MSQLNLPFGPPSIEYDSRLGERDWHAGFAGAVAGGVSIYVLKKGSRRGVIEQVLVRGLEGVWNAYGFKDLPGGSVVLFGLCAAQIMTAWLVRSFLLSL